MSLGAKRDFLPESWTPQGLPGAPQPRAQGVPAQGTGGGRREADWPLGDFTAPLPHPAMAWMSVPTRHPHLSHSYAETLKPSADLLEGGAFGRCLGFEGGAHMMGLMPIKETSGSFLCSKRMASCGPGRGHPRVSPGQPDGASSLLSSLRHPVRAHPPRHTPNFRGENQSSQFKSTHL